VSNYDLVTAGFRELTKVLVPFIADQLYLTYKDSWWTNGVLASLTDEQKSGLPLLGNKEDLLKSLDFAMCLYVIKGQWGSTFRFKLTREQNPWVGELLNARNAWAHKNLEDIDESDAYRALDTMARFVENINGEAYEEIRKLANQVRYKTTGPSTHAPVEPLQQQLQMVSYPAGLKPWRFVIQPHPDVQKGVYKQAEFAADLAQVARGIAAAEYQDGKEFFARTYITEGMKGLLTQAALRVTSGLGEPVIQLKTAFGGGKTHSLLALYHMMKNSMKAETLPGVKELLDASKVGALPRTRVVTLVGTFIDPTKFRRPANLPGIQVNTLWGEMAAQIAEQCNNPKLYDHVKEADKKGVSPGSKALTDLLNEGGPCLILMDEIVAYARKIYRRNDLPCGSYGSVISFMQELTEAVKASKRSIVVASIPESEMEAGGEDGWQVLKEISKVFGRMEYIWKPVGPDEGFSIVRRRLFMPVSDAIAADEACSAYSRMYNDSSGDFPIECKELLYKERMKDCYPIHPEVFDRLYNDWTTLEKFQKTRGVLRFMANVIFNLWQSGDQGLMIMPGSIPLSAGRAKEEISQYLPAGWDAIIDVDIDGPRSQAFEIDKKNSRYGQYMAARRCTRTIFLGSAPSSKGQRNRGIEDTRLRLGVVQPGEPVAVYNDVVGKLEAKLTYMYSMGQRYWFDSAPNLRRTMEDRAAQLNNEDVEMEIERRLSRLGDRGIFAGIHTVPRSSADIPDDLNARLVILSPLYKHDGTEKSPAMEAVKDYLENRGQSPRINKNMLLFLAADKDNSSTLEADVRKFLAWTSIEGEKEELNLDAGQQKEVRQGIAANDENVSIRINEAYIWLIVPTQQGKEPIIFYCQRLPASKESPTRKAQSWLDNNDQLITKWDPFVLVMELDKLLWRDKEHIGLDELWKMMCQYCYLPRLRDRDVLMNAVRAGLGSDEYFAYAEGHREGRYLGLRIGKTSPDITNNGLLVKLEIAKELLKGKEIITGPVGPGPKPGSDQIDVEVKPPKPKGKEFFASFEVDPPRLIKDAGEIHQGIVSLLSAVNHASIKVFIDIKAALPEGIEASHQRSLEENCRTLGATSFDFEDKE